MRTASYEPLILLGLTALALAISAIGPTDRLTWWLEVAPVLIGAAILVATYRFFPLTPLLYRLLFLLVTCICLAFSAFYEMIEWWVALLGDSAATDFLGTQGDVWDTQWDMFLALVGAITAQCILAARHDRASATPAFYARSNSARAVGPGKSAGGKP
jgi:uncharacterized membrane protein YjdF